MVRLGHNGCPMGITIWGIVYKSTAKNVNHKLSLSMYLIMGWMGVLMLPSINKTSLLFMLFILFGGIVTQLVHGSMHKKIKSISI